MGNIGPEYAHTRHNVGFDILDAFAEKQGCSFAPDRFGDTATCKYKGRTLLLIKPSTYVNLSGKAVRYWMDKEKIPKERVLVIVDDLALPLEKIRLRGKGSDAGHNGLKNIQEMIGTNKYPRLRFGIGHDFSKGRQIDFVLGEWTQEEKELVVKKIKLSVEVIESFVFAGLTNTMNKYNSLELGKGSE